MNRPWMENVQGRFVSVWQVSCQYGANEDDGKLNSGASGFVV
jgi:hypothetical protein